MPSDVQKAYHCHAMADDPQDGLEKYQIERAVEKFHGPLRRRAETAISAALNAIPFAGGSLASLMGSYSTEKKFERVFETLDALSDSVRNSAKKVDDILTRDQVTELLNETLPRIAKASGDDRIRFLRTGLINSFTTDALAYDTKHLFLTMVGDLSYVELKVLRSIYCTPDPYEHMERREPLVQRPTEPDAAASSIVYSGLLVEAQGHMEGRATLIDQFARCFKEWRDDGAKPALADQLAKDIGQSPEIVRLVSGRLDASGLTCLLPALSHRHYRVFEVTKKPWSLAAGVVYSSSATLNTAVAIRTDTRYSHTPPEEARTELGRRLVDFAMK
jgi:hypothetical protein